METDFQVPHPNSCHPSDIANDRQNGCVFACMLKRDNFGQLQKFKCSTVDLNTVYKNMDFFMCLHNPSTKQTFLYALCQKKRYFTQLKIQAVIPYQDFEEREFAQKQLFETLRAVFRADEFELRLTHFWNWNLHESELRLEWQQESIEDVFFGLEPSTKFQIYLSPCGDNDPMHGF